MAYPLPSLAGNNPDGGFLRAPDRLSILIAVPALTLAGMVCSVVRFSARVGGL
jgi:hypothetical protein